jgi:hypothetical protein
LISKAATVMHKLESSFYADRSNLGVAITLENGEEVCERVLSILISQLYPAKLPPTWRSHNLQVNK